MKALGICSWGYIYNKGDLVNPEPSALHTVRYNANVEVVKGVNPPLDPNHTHFLMVDDGFRNRLKYKTC